MNKKRLSQKRDSLFLSLALQKRRHVERDKAESRHPLANFLNVF